MAMGQGKFTVKGTVTDSLKANLAGATVVLMDTDSVMQKFSFTSADGSYAMQGVDAGEFILQVSFLGYLNYYKKLVVNGNIDVPPIRMLETTTSLNEVVIEGERTPIFLKKDTVEYSADAFKVQPNAVVEDLLKRLPGIEVERDGTVKAQGEEVGKVLVDGKEFFGNDPKTATKNLPADAVDKVQVFDQLSDMAQFTGIDDGEREKTINLKLKDDMKQGTFGNVTGGYGRSQNVGNENLYTAKANVNRFGKKTQLSFIGQANNTNQQGFSFQEYIGFLGGMGNLRNSGGFRLRSGDAGGVPLADGASDGFVETGAGGVNLNHSFSKKTDLNISYFYNSIGKDLLTERDRENFFQNGSLFDEDSSFQFNRNQTHSVSMRLQHKFDSTTELIYRGRFSLTDANSSTTALSRRFDAEGNLLNDQDLRSEGDGNRSNYNSELNFRKRMNNKGRNLVVSGRINGNMNDQTSSQLTNTTTINPFTGFVFDSLTNQNRLTNSELLNYRVRANYTEPIGQRRYIEFNGSHQNYKNTSDVQVFELGDPLRPIEQFVSGLSNNYRNDYVYNRAGLTFRQVRNKYNFYFGGEYYQSNLRGEILEGNFESIEQDFQFFLPNARFNFDFSNSRRLSIEYRTDVNEPSANQLQPVADNSDPQNIYIGNPDLRPEYRHNVNLRFFSFSQFSFISFFGNFSATYTQNNIANSTIIDRRSFIRTTMPVNVDDNLTLRTFANFSAPIRPLKTDISLNGNFTYTDGISPVNGENTSFDRYVSSLGLTLNNRNKDVIDILFGGRLSYTQTLFDGDESLDQSFFSQSYYTELGINIGKKFRLDTEFDITFYGGEENAFDDIESIPIWQASLSHYFLKNSRGELRFTAFDILNRNIGISRSANANYIEQSQITSLSQYFLLSFTYNLSKFGASAPGTDMRFRRFGGRRR